MPKKSKRRADKDDILIPHVNIEERADAPSEEELSGEELRARETVDSLIRDLFGTEQQKKDASATPAGQIARGAQPAKEPEKTAEPKPPAETPRPAEPIKIAEPAEPITIADVADAGAEPENAAPPLQTIEPAPMPERRELSFKEQMETSEEDFNLLLDLGYEDELGSAIGFELIRDHHEENIHKQHEATRRKRAAENFFEFKKQSDAEAFLAGYAKERRQWKIRLGVSLFWLVLLIVYERAALMAAIGGPLDGLLHPQAYILIGVQFLLFDAALCYKRLLEGLTRLVTFSPVDNSLFSVLLIATFLYHIVLIFLPHNGYPTLYLSPAALCLSLLCGVELINNYRKNKAFVVVSARNRKYALVPRISVGGKDHSARERLERDGADDDTRYARPVYFVRNYNANTERRADYHRNLGAELLLIFAAGVAMGLYATAVGKPAEVAMGMTFATVLFCAPAAALLFTAMPLFIAAVLRLREKGAIVGEGAVSDCEKPITLVLPDNEIFAAMSHERLRLDERSNAHRVSVVIRALLEKTESPLAAAFGVDVDSRLNPAAVTLTEVEPDGVCAVMADDGVCVRMGTPAYLARYGVETRVREEDDRLLGVAFNGRLAAHFSVQYTLQEDVLPLLRDLEREGVRVAIRSKDPCVRDEIMKELLAELRYPVTVSKPSVSELELRTRWVDSTIVAIGSCKEVARTYVACRRVRRVGVWGRVMQAGSIALGALLSVVFNLLGNLPSGITLTLWRMLWCALYAGLSYFCLRLPQREKEQEIPTQMQMEISDLREEGRS